jgi:hypothetical protein|uniref:Uncharacterized protein n=1 Tax=viral metagenome TaxID=1070528 RepID=A0A6C0JAK1_9ZZZZ
MNSFIDMKIFIISFSIGLLGVYLLGEDQRIVYVYPTQTNHKDIVLKSKSGDCFGFVATEVDCQDKTVVKFPIE